MSSHEVIATDGLVGAGLFPSTGAMQESWTAPDGRSGGYTGVGVFISGQTTNPLSFAGPKGKWGLSWKGAMSTSETETPIAAIWAPIGDAWRYFSS
jgi:hypothetical protein